MGGHGGRGHCYFFSMEQLSKENAGILCASHGGWIVEIPHPPVNYWIKAKLLDLCTPDKQEKAGVPWGNLFWMGAVTEDRHDDHVTETGGGLMPMPASSGLTGETTSPMTSTARTA